MSKNIQIVPGLPAINYVGFDVEHVILFLEKGAGD